MDQKKESEEEMFSKSEQMARDMQLAYELQSQQELGDEELARRLAAGADIGGSAAAAPASNGSRISASSSNNGKKQKPMFSFLGNAAPSMFGRQNAHLAEALNDGSASMEQMGSLLYVPCEINGRVVEMMIDSGSQTSVISTPMMKKLKLQKRLNTACQGVAAGVGAANILGRVEKCPVIIGAGVEFLLYFLVLDVPHDMMILGIDQVSSRVLSLFVLKFDWADIIF